MNPTVNIREYLEGWGSELDEQRLALALTAAGVLEAQPWLVTNPDPWQSLRDTFGDAPTPVTWERPDEILSRLEPEAAADSIADLSGLRLTVITAPGLQASLYGWVQALEQHPSVRVVVEAEPAATDLSWQWPLRFGFSPDPGSTAIRAGFEGNRWWPQLQKLVDPGQPCDILVLPMSVSSAEGVDRSDVGGSALVVVLGEIDVPPEDVPRAADRIAFQLEAWGCHLANSGRSESDWLNRLTESLAHNDPIDVALVRADAGATGTYTSLAQDMHWQSRLEWVIGRYADHLGSLGDHPIEVPDTTAGLLPGSPPVGTVPAALLGQYLRDALDNHAFGFSGEGHEATGFSLLVEGVGELPGPAPTAEMGNGMGAGPEGDGIEVRIINGAVKKDGSLHRLDLEAGEEYTLEVWIGVESEESITEAGAPEFPSDELPSGPNQIDVVFTCLDNQEEVQRGQVTLPDRGDSDRTELALRFPEPGTVFGRLALVHGGRVIQTAVLRADVVAGRPSRLGRPRITVEEVIRSRITGVDEGSRFDLAVVVNRDGAGRKTTAAIRDDGVTLRSPQGLEESMDKLRDALTAVADDPDAFAEMTSQQTLTWLHSLAHFGYALHREFIEDHGIDPGYFEKGRVQVISARADAYLPVEFFYELEPPTQVELCPDWQKAVEEGECASCAALGLNDPRPICLSGFWGVKYVVERHVHQNPYGGIPGDWRLQREPSAGRNKIKPLESIVWGLSDNILESDRRAMARALGRKLATKANSWEEVQEKVGTLDPSTVFFLPHTDYSGLVGSWEIGGQPDTVTLIEQRMCAPREKDVLVVLLGCDTAHTGIPYQGVVPGFRRAGAAVVVTTINAILGRHAVPVAKELLKILKAMSAEPERSMGDVMLGVRRRALLDGYPMVLSVVAFGDADWVLTK